jgi:hypothetical protein
MVFIGLGQTGCKSYPPDAREVQEPYSWQPGKQTKKTGCKPCVNAPMRHHLSDGGDDVLHPGRVMIQLRVALDAKVEALELTLLQKF